MNASIKKSISTRIDDEKQSLGCRAIQINSQASRLKPTDNIFHPTSGQQRPLTRARFLRYEALQNRKSGDITTILKTAILISFSNPPSYR